MQAREETNFIVTFPKLKKCTNNVNIKCFSRGLNSMSLVAGVYITLLALGDGTRDLKRVGFRRESRLTSLIYMDFRDY
ncbi:hypothetical protein YC2023_016526 [Brassica napus]